MALDILSLEVNLSALFDMEISSRKGVVYLRKRNSNVTYFRRTGNWTCERCNEDVLYVQVHHTILEGPFEDGGIGRVYRDNISYCPNCEEKPSETGEPIKIKETLDEFFLRLQKLSPLPLEQETENI